MKNISFFLLLGILFLSACRKDMKETIQTAESDPPITLIQTTINGKVVNESGNPISGASIKAGSETQISQQDGSFRFEKVAVQKSGDIVQAEYSGYFTGATHNNFSPDGTTYTEIKLLEKGVADIVSSSSGGTITKSNGLKIEVPANVIVRSNGFTYQGDVSLYSRWIDPTSNDLGAIMPGALTASDSDDNPLALTSFGMVAIELESESGEQIFVRESSNLEVEMPIPSTLLSDAPPTIDLWEYDLESAQWLLSSACGKVDDYYVVNIPQAGYWNCDVAQPAICLSGQVFNSDLTFGCYLQVIVENQSNNFIYWGFTDSIGYFCGSVPQDVPLTISIIDHCDNIVYTDEIGPFAEDFELEDIILEETVAEYMINISGSIMHCFTDDIPDGHAAIRYPGSLKIYPIVDSGYDIDLALKCTEFPNLEITYYSSSQTQSTETIIHNSGEDLALGQLLTCEDLEDYFNLESDGFDYWTSPTQFYLKPNTNEETMILEGLSGAGKFTIELENYQGVGVYVENVLFKIENDAPFPDYPALEGTNSDVNVEITSVTAEFIEGAYYGTAINLVGGQSTVSGQFKIKVAP